MGEKHANEDYVHAERSQAPSGTSLPPEVSAVAHAEHAQEGQSLGAADVGVAAAGTGDGPERNPDDDSSDDGDDAADAPAKSKGRGK